MVGEFDEGALDVVFRNRKEGKLGVHHSVPYEFVIALSRYDVP